MTKVEGRLSLENRDIDWGGRRPRVELRELTLRQQHHMDRNLTVADKLYLLRALDEIGVKRTSLWGKDPDAIEIVTRSRDAGNRIGITLMGKAYFEDECRDVIATARQCGADVFFPGRGGDVFLEEMGWTQERMLKSCLAAIEMARAEGLEVSTALAYSTQTDIVFLEEFCSAAVAAGAHCVHISDSLGVATPTAMRSYVTTVRKVTDVPIEVHCHDDFGLALANVIASVEAGADRIDTVVNGMDPHGAGLAALEEVAAALELLYGVETGIDLGRLTELSRLHERLTGMQIARNKSIVGPRAFARRVALGSEQSVQKHDQFYASKKVVSFDPEIVGNSPVLLIGKYSGKNEVRRRLDELGVTEIEDDVLENVVRLTQQRGRERGRVVRDEELRYFVDLATAGMVDRPERESTQ